MIIWIDIELKTFPIHHTFSNFTEEIKKFTPMVDKAVVIKDFTETMKNYYGDRLSKIILYGSYARGDFKEESDIDFMVLLNDEEVRTMKELFNTNDEIYDLTLKHNILVSIFATSKKKFELATKAFYRFIKKEGVIVYE